MSGPGEDRRKEFVANTTSSARPLSSEEEMFDACIVDVAYIHRPPRPAASFHTRRASQRRPPR